MAGQEGGTFFDVCCSILSSLMRNSEIYGAVSFKTAGLFMPLYYIYTLKMKYVNLCEKFFYKIFMNYHSH